jgi:transposase
MCRLPARLADVLVAPLLCITIGDITALGFRSATDGSITPIRQRLRALERDFHTFLADTQNVLSSRLRERFSDLFRQLRELGEMVANWEREILSWHRENPLSRRLQIPGIGPLTASASVASVGDARTRLI